MHSMNFQQVYLCNLHNNCQS